MDHRSLIIKTLDRKVDGAEDDEKHRDSDCSANTSAIQSETPGGWSSCGKCLDDMRLMQRLAISGLLSVILILLLTGTIVTRRDTLASVVDRGVAPEERNEQSNPAWVQDNVVPGQNEPEIEDRDKDKDRRLDTRHKQSEPSAVGPPAASVPGAYVIRPPNPPLDDVTNQRREKVKEMMKHGWDNYVRYAWGKNELRPISKRGHSASIFGASNMGATIVDGLDTLYIMGLHDEFKQGRDWIAENLDFDIQLPIGMDFFDNEYYGLTRNLMASIGLWPYQKPEHRIVRVLCVSFILVLAILTQLTTFVTHEYSMTLLIEVLSFVILSMIYALKYNIVYFNSNQIKKLFDQIQRDWNLIKDMDELKILQKYAYKARFYTMFSGLIVYPGTFAFLLIVFIPDILDKIMPLDEPRPRQFPIHIEMFFDKERYFYYISILFIVAAFLGMTVLMATETMYMTFLQHACCLFELISHRLTYAFNTYLSRTTPLKTKCKFCTKLFNAFITHQHCLEFIEDMQRGFSSSYFVLCIFGVASLSINMFRLLNAVTIHNIVEAILIGLFVYAHFCYIFWMNYFGQDMIDHSECFFQQIYNIRWYTVPLYAQKLLLIVLQRSAKSSRIIIGSLFVASLEGFATLISMSMSYCMVMYSVRT